MKNIFKKYLVVILGMMTGMSIVSMRLVSHVVKASNPTTTHYCLTGTSQLWNDFVEATAEGREPILPDFSYAGYHYSERPIPTVKGPIFDVTDYGAVPDDDDYDDDAIQAAIDDASNAGGGVVFFPPGRYLISPNTNPNEFIRIAASNIVLRGSGSEDGGTEIFMDHMKPGSFIFRVAPPSSSSSTLATITVDAPRESFWVTVDSASALQIGQRVVINYQNAAYNSIYWPPLELDPHWTRVYQNGPPFKEVHSIAEISGNRVRFYEPLHFTIAMNSAPFTLRSIQYLEEVGIEDIRFTGNWDSYPEEFVHHRNAIHDAGWSMLSLIRVVNGWVRRCEFKNLNQAIYVDTGVALTFDSLHYTGKKGHTCISPRRGYGVLVKDNVDLAAQHHGPAFGYSGVGTVYLRHRMQRNQQIDSHGGVPYASLLDQVTGGVLSGNGGPYENHPNHGRYFVFWNFAHRSSGSKTYNFWNLARRENNSFALPIFAGFTADRSVTFVDEGSLVQANESFGTPVTPRSLFEAQLALRRRRGAVSN